MIYWGVYPLRRKLRLALAGAAEQLDLFLALVDDGLRAGSQQLAGIEALALLILASLDILAGSLTKTSWHSVLMLILETPRLMAFAIMSSGMPVPPCRTRGMLLVALWIRSRASKSRPFQLAG